MISITYFNMTSLLLAMYSPVWVPSWKYTGQITGSNTLEQFNPTEMMVFKIYTMMMEKNNAFKCL